jgi:hypothetical protein
MSATGLEIRFGHWLSLMRSVFIHYGIPLCLLRSSTWFSADQLSERLDTLALDGRSGDIYARQG